MEKLEDPLINELLLVGSALGSIETTTTEDGSLIERFIRGENCLEWLQDLQRALRRDDDYTRAIAVKLGSWKVVETKLLPLLLECRDDLELVVTLVKIFVMLTMPLHPSVKNWLLLEVDGKGGEDAVMMRAEKVRRQATARAQVANLLAMKRAFVNAEVIAVLVAILEEPLGNTRGGRSEDDTLVIELVLTLLRNLLCIEDEGGVMGGSSTSDGGADRLHNELLLFLEQEYALEVLLFLCQGVQLRDNSSWNLLLMEIVFHIIRGQDPSDVAAAAVAQQQQQQQDGGGGGDLLTSTTKGLLPSSSSSVAVLQKDDMSRAALTKRSHMSRHNRFGTQLKLSDPNTGLIRVVAKAYHGGSSLLDALPQASRKRTRKNAVFLVGGAGGGGGGASDAKHQQLHDPITSRAHACLARLSESFIESAYEPFVRSLKDEFRRDSSRLEADDRTVFFRITRFFLAFNRFVTVLSKKLSSSSTSSNKDWTSSLVQSMDVLSFNLVLSTMDCLMSEQQYRPLVHALALYKEMIHFLAALAHSSDENHATIALGLQHKLFYAPEPVDKLSRIIACWKPALFPRSFLADILDLTHVQLALLEANARTVAIAEEADQQGVNGGDDDDGLKKRKKKMGDVVDVSKGFDFPRYFASLCTNQVVRMLTYLLEQYKVNSLCTNKQILAFFQRMRQHDLDNTRGGRNKKNKHYDPFIDDPEIRVSAKDKNTLEPMLFNVPLLMVLHRILEDRTITSQPTHPLFDLVRFAKSVVRHFGDAATWNPLLLVEALFQHPFPHNWCANFQQAYVSSTHVHDIAKAARGDDDDEYRQSEDGDDDGDDDDEETDDGDAREEEVEAAAAAAKEGLPGARGGAPATKNKKKRKKKKPQQEVPRASDDEEEEWDGMVLTAPRQEEEDKGSDDDDENADGEGEPGGGESGKKRKKKKKKGSSKAAAGVAIIKKRSPKWDFDEDSALRKNYAIYKGTRSCLEVLAKLGPIYRKGRTTDMIKRRLQFLKIWEKPGAKTSKPAKAAADDEGGSDSESSSASSSSSRSSSSKRATKKTKASEGDRDGADDAEVSAGALREGQQEEEGEETNNKPDEGPTLPRPSSAEKGEEGGETSGKKKKRLRRQEESDSSSSDESLDIV